MFKKNQLRKALSLFVCLALVLSVLTGLSLTQEKPAYAASGEVIRLAGDDRYETSSKIADNKFTTPNYAIVTRGDAYADGLAASVLAGALNAPVLLVRSDTLPATISSRLTALGKPRVIILGGTAAVSTAVENSIKNLVGSSYVTRIGGADRFATAALVAAEAAKHATLSRTAFIVNGFASADSLVAGPAAFRDCMPILQVYKDSIPDVTKQAIANRSINKLIIVGGTDVVTKAVETALGKLSSVTSVSRVWGSTRYETSVAFAKDQFPYVGDFCLVRGADDNLADAIGATVLGYPILYVEQNSIRTEVNNYLDSRVTGSSTIYIIGGIAAVSDTVRDRARALVSGEAVFNPAQSATNVSTSVQPTISFPRTISNTSGTAISDSNVDSLITFRKGGSSGSSVSFSASIDSDKRVITVRPTSALDTSTTYYLSVGSVRDSSGTISGSSVTWSTGTTATGPPSSVLGLSEVECVGLREVKVTFNQTLTKASAEDKDNYNILKANQDVVFTGAKSAKLQSDNRTVLLTLTKTLKQDTYRIKVKDVYSSGGRYIDEPYDIRSFLAVDNTRPKVESVTVTGTNSLKVSMTEFLDIAIEPLVKVDGVGLTVASMDPDLKFFTVSLGGGAIWEQSRTYNITVSKATDLAGNEMLPSTHSFKPPTGTTGPTISSITAVDQDTVRIVFNRELDATSINSAKLVYKRGSGSSLKESAEIALNSTGFFQNTKVDPSGKTYEMDVEYSWPGSSGVKLFASSDSETFEIRITGLKDVLLYPETDKTLAKSVTLKKDTTNPSITSHTVSIDSAKITLILNEQTEPVSGGTDISAQVRITDSSGTEFSGVTGTLENDEDANISRIILTRSGGFSIGTHNVRVLAKTVKDGLTYSTTYPNNKDAGTNSNKLINYSVSVGAPGDNPKVTGDPTASDNVFILTYNVRMGQSAIDRSNYRLDGATLGSDAVLTFIAGSTYTQVRIDLSAPGTVNTEGEATITATSSIKSAAGLPISDTPLTMTGFVDNTAPSLLSAEVNRGESYIYLTFDEPMAAGGSAADSFLIKYGKDEQTLSASIESVPGYPHKIKLEIPTPVNWNVSITVKTLSTADVTDANGEEIKADITKTATKKN